VAAIRELERLAFGDSSVAIRPLVGTLADEDTEVRVAAAEALAKIIPSAARSGSGREVIRAAMNALIASLKDPDPEVRFAAATALGEIMSPTSRTGTRPRRRGGKTPLPAQAAPRAPARAPRVAVVLPIDRGTVLDALVEAFADPNVKVRAAVLDALASGGPGACVDPPRVYAAGLEDESPVIRRVAVDSLASFGRVLDPWIPILVRLAEHDPDRLVRAACSGAIGQKLGPPAVTAAAVPQLVPGLASANPQLRIQIAALLGRLGPDARSAIPGLIRVLNDPLEPQVGRVYSGSMMEDVDPACAAASALARIAPASNVARQLIAALTEVARSGPRIRRGAAAYALGQFGPAAAEAVPVLITMIKDADPTRLAQNETWGARADRTRSDIGRSGRRRSHGGPSI
jgi:HEAT repeat protein